MKSIARNILRRCGYDIVRHDRVDANYEFPPDLTDEEKEICAVVAPFTMTGVERIVALIHATRYVSENDIKGDIVECGVWRGGSMMVVAHVLRRLGDTTRKLYLYDTFEGMTAPSEKDIQFDGTPANQLLDSTQKNTGVWCYADKTDVLNNLRSTGYPERNIFLVEGKVEETIPGTLPDSISLLRLDTDWYESTKHELTHLYPRLSRNGILIIDDYGHWRGAKEATDEYFGQRGAKPFLHRVDYTGRLAIKV
jgi:O-methyltransferase